MLLSLLGPPQLLIGDRLWPQLPRKAVAMVAYLVTQGGQADRGTLASLLWEGDEESTRRNLRQELFRLKGTPWERMLEQGSQQIVLTAVETDLQRFLEHLSRGRWAEAVGLWRGGLLAGFEVRANEAFEEWLAIEQTRWQNLYREAMLGWARSLEAASQRREALSVYQKLLEQDPLQEAEQQAVMRLLAVLGELPAAMRQYEQYARLLALELGVEPSPETQALYHHLRRGSLDAVVLAPASPASLQDPPLVARSEDWAWLETHLGRGLVLLVGEVGVGKSRLAQDFARRRGQVFQIRQRESLRELGFGGLIEAVRSAIESGQSLEGLEPVWREELAQLLPELGVFVGGAANAKLRLFEALARMLLTLVRPGGTVVWEDLHWADAPALEFLGYLTQRAPSLGIYLLGTTRSEGYQRGHPLYEALRSLSSEGLLWVHTLEALSQAGVRELVQRLSGTPGGTLFAERLHKATGGNPLYLLQTLRFLFDRGLLRVEGGRWHTPFDSITADYRELPLPPSVREVVQQRLERLPQGARELAQVLAIADAALEPSELAAFNRDDLALEHLLHGGIVQESSEGYVLAHDLLRSTILETLSAAARRRLHHRLAEVLRDTGAPPERLAHHLEAAGQLTQAARAHLAVGRKLRVGPLGRSALAHYSKALELMGPLAPPQERFQVLAECTELKLALGERAQAERLELARLLSEVPEEQCRLFLIEAEAAVQSGRVAEGIQAARQALELARTAWQKGKALFRLAWLEYRGGDPDAQLEPLTEAIRYFELSGDRFMEAHALRNLAGYYSRIGDQAKAREAYNKALVLAQGMADDLLLRRLKADGAIVDFVRGAYHRSIATGETLLAEARERGDLWAVWDALHILGLNAGAVGLSPQLEQSLHQALREAEVVRAYRDVSILRTALGTALMVENRLLEALEELQQALRVMQDLGEQATLGYALFSLGFTQVELGRYEEGEEVLTRAAEHWGERKQGRDRARALAGLALSYLRRGERERALQASSLAYEGREEWAEGIFDLPFILYARARALGDEEGAGLLERTQQLLRSLSERLPPEFSARLLNNRFVQWALAKRAGKPTPP
jgi:DNA-binding SARP family transcriptional activator